MTTRLEGPSTPEKLDLRIERTYKSLSDAFTRMLATKHYEDVTVSELCDEAMIRRTTFYKHFADKDEFFSFYVRRLREEFQKRSEPPGGREGVLDYNVRMMHELVAFIEENDHLVAMCFTSSAFSLFDRVLNDEISRSLLARLELAQAEGAHGEGARFCASPAALANFMAGGLLRTLYRWFQEGKPDRRRLEEDLAALMACVLREA